LSKIFKNNVYPVGEEVEYNPSRSSSAEARENERLAQGDPLENYQNIRRAAEVHRQVRAYARQNIKPGMTMTEIAEMIEDGSRALVEEAGMDSGIGFPTGLSVNEVAAHYTPNAGDTKGRLLPATTVLTISAS
jgi:methionyl aminopeptidase